MLVNDVIVVVVTVVKQAPLRGFWCRDRLGKRWRRSELWLLDRHFECVVSVWKECNGISVSKEATLPLCDLR